MPALRVFNIGLYSLMNGEAPNPIHSVGEQQQEDQNKAQLEDSNEVLCAVCQTTGELLCCHKCHKEITLDYQVIQVKFRVKHNKISHAFSKFPVSL
uniref:Uncharacterized protein n=1 Tax=Amphilophus citrinellus TaxID=61819 RepID=A0A3Q0SV53_AMPCI